MFVSKVSWRRTISKNFQSQTAEFEVTIGADERPADALSLCQRLVDDALGDGPSETEIQQARQVLKRAAAL